MRSDTVAASESTKIPSLSSLATSVLDGMCCSSYTMPASKIKLGKYHQFSVEVTGAMQQNWRPEQQDSFIWYECLEDVLTTRYIELDKPTDGIPKTRTKVILQFLMVMDMVVVMLPDFVLLNYTCT